jgi:hypothetical protein
MNQKECRQKRPWPNVRCYSNICLQELRRPKKPLRRIGVSSEIRTWHLPNTEGPGFNCRQGQGNFFSPLLWPNRLWDPRSLHYSCASERTRLHRRQLMTYTITSFPQSYYWPVDSIFNNLPVFVRRWEKEKAVLYPVEVLPPIADSFHVATMARKHSMLNLQEINRNNTHTALASVLTYYGWVSLIF